MRFRSHFILLSLAFIWIFVNAPTDSLWYDETVNAYLATSSWSTIWEWTTEIDNQLPLHFVALKLWGMVFGASEVSFRLFSQVCAWLSVAGLIVVTKRLFASELITGFATVMFMASGGFLYAATEVRTYGLALMLLIWSIAFILHNWESPQQTKWHYHALLAVLLVLLAMTHYTAWLAIGVLGLFVLARLLINKGVGWQQALITFGPMIVMVLLWIAALGGRDFNEGTAFAGDVSLQYTMDIYLNFALFGQVVTTDDTVALATLYSLSAVLAGAIWVLATPHRPQAFLIAAVGIIPLIVMVLAVQFVEGKLSGRHIWMLWAVLPLLLAGGLYTVPSMLPKVPSMKDAQQLQMMIGVVLLSFALPVHFQDTEDEYIGDFREAMSIINANAHPDDLLILRDGTLFTAAEYYDVQIDYVGIPQDQLTNVDHQVQVFETLDILTTADFLERPRLWVLSWQADTMDPTELGLGIPEYYSQGNQQVWLEEGERGVQLVSYELAELPSQDLHTHVVDFAGVVQVPPDGPSLLGIDVYHTQSGDRCGSIVHAWWWRGEQDYPDTFISLRLERDNEPRLYQVEMPPAGYFFPQERWEPFVPILGRAELHYPCGYITDETHLRMVVYDAGGDKPTQPIDLGIVPIR